MKTIYLAGGCFWGTQKFFDQFAGVLETEVGYANGPTANPSYQNVCAGSGHAETVRIVYDENVVSLTRLLDWYFLTIDPTAYHRQGMDMGVQYRTGIYYTDAADLPEIEERFKSEQAKYKEKLQVEVQPLENFYPAEEYHQKYLEKNPGGYCHIPPRMMQMEKRQEKNSPSAWHRLTRNLRTLSMSWLLCLRKTISPLAGI